MGRNLFSSLAIRDNLKVAYLEKNCSALLNFGKKYEDNLRVIFDQCPNLHLDLDALSNQIFLNGIYCVCTP